MKNLLPILTITVLLASGFVTESYGIPAFARKYKTSCATCHYAPPMLNAFGKAFFNNGFRWPGGDENFIKEDPVSLGADANKKAFPDAIWPADIPGTAPLAVFATGRINYAALSDVKWGFDIPSAINILYAGTIGEKFSFLGETEIANENNETKLGFSFIFQYDHSPGLHLKVGEVRSDPTPRDLKLTSNDYNIENLASRNGWSFGAAQFGLELWGAINGPGNHGGLTYRLGVVNGNGEDLSLTATKPQKDFCGKLTYKIGGLSETGVNPKVKKGDTSLPSKPYIDNSLTLGGFFYKGTETMQDVKDEDLTVFGGDAELWFNRFILSGSAMWMKSDLADTTDTRKSMAYYIQGSGLVYPWLIGLVRYEWTNENLDNNDVKPVTSIIPGITVLVRPNVKLVFEYKKFLDDLNKKNDTFVFQVNFGI